jgi:hypothetical protein
MLSVVYLSSVHLPRASLAVFHVKCRFLLEPHQLIPALALPSLCPSCFPVFLEFIKLFAKLF